MAYDMKLTGNYMKLDGVLTYIGELSASQKGNQYVRGFLTSYKGEGKNKTQIFNCAFTAFGEHADTIASMGKGQQIKVFGHMETSLPRQQQGGDQKEYTTFIIDGFTDQQKTYTPKPNQPPRQERQQTTKPDPSDDLF